MEDTLLRIRKWVFQKTPWARLSLLGLLGCMGCAQVFPVSVFPQQQPQVVQNVQKTPAAQKNQDGEIQLVQLKELPPPSAVEVPVVQVADKTLPINLDTVLGLAQDQNGQIQLAREQLNEAFGNKALADKAWIPDIYMGLSYYRHEGGIQDQDGRFIHSSFGSLFAGLELAGRLDLKEAVFLKIDAERKILQQRGEVSRLSSEKLLDASSTYVDLLTARNGETVSREIEQKLEKLLDQTEKLAMVEPGVQVEVHRLKAQLSAQQQITREVQAGARSAGAKLLQLLNLDPHAQLVVMDPKLVPFQLIPPNTPTDELVAHALTNGPGVRELEELLALIARAQCQAQGPGQFMPVFEVRMAEGAFGAGPGSSSRWDNRWDLALQARWNLTNLHTAREQKWVAQSKSNQAHLGYQNLRSQLILGVQEGVESAASNAERIRMAEKEIEHSREAYKLSDERLANNIPGSSPSEVLLAIRSLGAAQLGYLNAVRDFDKAQLRLLILTGKGPAVVPHH